MFYDAMLSAGVGRKRAWMMYKAVQGFGPKWDDPKVDQKCEEIDENYNFEDCSVNVAPPATITPLINRKLVENFLSTIDGEVDDRDIETLRRNLNKLN